MSGRLKVRFGPDTPTASVEVVSPDLTTVGQMRMAPGIEQEIDVPSERSFLRVHLPSGRVVTLRSDDSLDRRISLSDLKRDRASTLWTSRPSGATTRHNVRSYLSQAEPEHAASWLKESVDPALLLDGLVLTRLRLRASDKPIPGVVNPDGREVTFDVSGLEGMLEFSAETGKSVLTVRVPGNATRILARADPIQTETDQRDLYVAVRVSTDSPDGDAILGYLARGDMRSAESMLGWVGYAVDLLFGKLRDPYAAAVGGYLLLRLRRFDDMHDWARNLADWFPQLPDGAVIWAWQLIGQRGKSASAEIRSYLEMAVQRGLPVYTEGLRLLSEGLTMMEPKLHRSLSERVNRNLGRGVWNSPFTAGVQDLSGQTESVDRIQFDVDVAPRA